MTNFNLTKENRLELWQFLLSRLEEYYTNTAAVKVSPKLDLQEILDTVRQHDFKVPLEPKKALDFVVDTMRLHIVHTPHPQYFGLFNPRANIAGIFADVITAVFNPQMAAWSHSPFAAETENYLIHEMGLRFGYSGSGIDGTFCTGGAEANLTAVLCALNHAFPDYLTKGLRAIDHSPVLYCSAQAHHSVIRAARVAGLGSEAVRSIPVASDLKLDAGLLDSQVETDKLSGFTPFMVIGTAGTTGTGSIDDLIKLSQIAEQQKLWFHADAAYGGAAALSERMKHLLKGIEKAHSITFDVHKWLSVPMAASMFITREREILHRTFRINTDYMPKDARGIQITDPFAHSVQWSRRFTGLKLYLTLLFFGWKGIEEVIETQASVGDKLKELLLEDGWKILNDSPLPVVCFTDSLHEQNPEFANFVCDAVVKSGKAWISVYPIAGRNSLRACITNYDTTAEDVAFLVKLLHQIRDKYRFQNDN
jgi:glutamate/tyrosine decarboxylase-like PLP-dependent enzyme